MPHGNFRHEYSGLRIVYNRVPKCGSSTTLSVFRTLARKHSFTFLSSEIYNQTIINHRQEKALIDSLRLIKAPWLYNRHVGILNFTNEGYSMPEYINLVRDPIERKRSGYYFRGPRRFHESFNDCVKNLRKECISSPTLQLFCGHGPSCKKDSSHSLQIAKQNVMKYYRVVGLTEDIESFFKLLEIYYPDMFRDAVNIYRNQPSRNVDSKKKDHELTQDTIQRLKFELHLEYKFYEFIKQRFYIAKQNAGIL